MKGQLNIEFVISIGLFFIIIGYCMFAVFNLIPAYHRESEKTEASIKADMIADMLIFDEGYPVNWNANNVERIGLSNGVDYYLAQNKITQLRNLCNSDYVSVREKMHADVIIKITNMENDDVELYCRPPAGQYRYEKTVTRFAVKGNERMKVEVSVLV
jgi:hypothetical protein